MQFISILILSFAIIYYKGLWGFGVLGFCCVGKEGSSLSTPATGGAVLFTAAP